MPESEDSQWDGRYETLLEKVFYKVVHLPDIDRHPKVRGLPTRDALREAMLDALVREGEDRAAAERFHALTEGEQDRHLERFLSPFPAPKEPPAGDAEEAGGEEGPDIGGEG